MQIRSLNVKHIDLDRADERVKDFVRTLPIEPDGVELKLNGKVICKVVSPQHLTTDERDAILARGRELVRRARERNKGVPAKIIEREVQEAVDEVRGRQRR
jgi:hypothetical protein